jgi:hypothetical protein
MASANSSVLAFSGLKLVVLWPTFDEQTFLAIMLMTMIGDRRVNISLD